MATTYQVNAKPTLLGHLQIARADHWVKNVFVLPGIIVALSLERDKWHALNLWTLFGNLLDRFEQLRH